MNSPLRDVMTMDRISAMAETASVARRWLTAEAAGELPHRSWQLAGWEGELLNVDLHG